jgi:hypothetical protein
MVPEVLDKGGVHAFNVLMSNIREHEQAKKDVLKNTFDQYRVDDVEARQRAIGATADTRRKLQNMLQDVSIRRRL